MASLDSLFAAAFHGTCTGCGDDIKPDDMVCPDGEGGHLCEDCTQEGYYCDC